MSFRILYVEDDEGYSNRVKNAVAESNKRAQSRPVRLKSVSTPEQIKDALSENYDLVLADLLFRDDSGTERSRLDDIIRFVTEWSKENQLEKPLPIIAYTRREKGGLDYCLERRNALYDIWDKASASPPYVAWRLTQIAIELSRTRPDALLERLIRMMPSGARWHKYVGEMARRYAAGWTEADQIEGAGHSISQIAHELGSHAVCKPYWNVMSRWEPLGRAASRHTRGHARHVINVFWLGYYLLHHEYLREWFRAAWTTLLLQRKEMAAVTKEDGVEALSDCWFYAGLFHDVANCVEKSRVVVNATDDLLATFGGLVEGTSQTRTPASDLGKQAALILNDLGATIASQIMPPWERGLTENHPDHGMVAAAHLVTSISDPKQLCFAREAARGMAIHNLIGQADTGINVLLSWQAEPIACLLLLCDQIQTWDRERGDPVLSDKDGPERAELLELAVTNVGARPHIDISIEYIAPRHLDHDPQIFQRVKDELEAVLKDKPDSALRRIQKPWPFTLTVKCWLSGAPLDTKMKFE